MKWYKFILENPGEANLADIVERLGAIIAFINPKTRHATASTHERTKEVWGALKTLLSLPPSKWKEWIPLIVERYTPPIGSQKLREYYKALLKALLEKFAVEAAGQNPAFRRKLAKIVRNALDSVVASPYPQICFLVKEFFPSRVGENMKSRCKEVWES